MQLTKQLTAQLKNEKILTLLSLFLFVTFSLTTKVMATPLSMRVLDGDIRSVLYSIANMNNINLILNDEVKGTVTLSFNSLEAKDALYYLASANGYSVSENGNTFIISKEADTIQNLYVFPIQHRDAKDIAKTLNTIFASNVSLNNTDKDTQNTVDKFRFEKDGVKNLLVFCGTAKEVAEIKKILPKIDVPAKQISIEAKVIAVEKNALKDLGLSWEWSKIPQYPKYKTKNEKQTKTLPNGTKVTIDVPVTEIERKWHEGENIPGIIAFGRSIAGHPFEFYYSAELKALFAEGKADILARPNITTIQGKEAIINIGGEIPIPTVAVTNATTTTSYIYRPAGIILKCLPEINEDGKILAKIYTEISSPHYVEGMNVYRFNRRLAETSVFLNDGETMVIGGLIGSEESKNFSKIPFLGDLPILGKFFQSIKRNKTESEVIIFLTAKILP